MDINETMEKYLTEGGSFVDTLKKSLTNEEMNELKDAVYKISDAYEIIKDINKSMKKNKKWAGQGDVEAIEKNLKHLTGNYAGGIGSLLKDL